MPLSFKDLQGVKGNPSAEVAPNRRLKINPGQNYVYDLPKELIVRVQSEFPLATLLEQAEPLEELGGKFMALLIREADSETYRDRTADMIEQHKLLNELAGLVDAGTIRTTLTERLEPINAANLRKAHAIIETGRTVGKVVLEN